MSKTVLRISHGCHARGTGLVCPDQPERQTYRLSEGSALYPSTPVDDEAAVVFREASPDHSTWRTFHACMNEAGKKVKL